MTTSSQRISQYKATEQLNLLTFNDILSRKLHLVGYDVAPPAQPQSNGLLEKLGIDAKAMDAEAEERAKSYAEAVKSAKSKVPLPTRARAAAARERFIQANPGASYRYPHMSQTIRARFPRIPPHRVPPPPVVSEPIVEFADRFIPIAASSQGSGSGFYDGQGVHDSVAIYWNFLFTPAMTSNWKFQALMWSVGDYLLHANDTILTSKEADGKIYFGIGTAPLRDVTGPIAPVSTVTLLSDWGTPAGDSSFVTEFDKGDDNINMAGPLDIGDVVEYDTMLCDGEIQAGVTTLVSVFAWLETYAQGAGSIAELNFNGPNQGIGCFSLRIAPA